MEKARSNVIKNLLKGGPNDANILQPKDPKVNKYLIQAAG